MRIEENEPAAAAHTGLADRLKARTWSLHREAERSGILQDLLHGRAGRDAYVLLLGNLLTVYEALERGLERAATAVPLLRDIARPDVFRAAAIRSDLRHIAGGSTTDVAPLPSASRYAGRIEEAAALDASLLIPHAYVRYLGDLNGGQILKRLLGKSLDLGPEGLSFYDFPAVEDTRRLALDYRSAVDRTMSGIASVEGVLAEASTAFQLGIALSNEVKRVAESARPGSLALALE